MTTNNLASSPTSSTSTNNYDWEIVEDNKNKKGNGNANIKVSQPISGQTVTQPMGGYTDGTAINSLPNYDVSQSNQQQQMPNYDSMYKQDTTPLKSIPLSFD